ALDERGALYIGRWTGASGDTFEIPFVCVTTFAPDGRYRRLHGYDLDQLDAARALYRELKTVATPQIENAATRSADEFAEAWRAHDWDRIAACFPAGYRESDRRKMVLLELDRDQFLGGLRVGFEISASSRSHALLATRGDRLGLYRYCWH